jgi:subtilisin family serine protease
MQQHRIHRTRRSRCRALAVERLEDRRALAADSLIGLDLLRADPRFADLDGSGYSVVVIDHGIDLDHPFFGPDENQDGVADRIVFQQDYGDDDPVAQEDNSNGHGTSVASILASQDSAHRGVAPGINLIVLKLFKSGLGTANYADLERALQWVEANADERNILAVNLSITDQENHNRPFIEPTTSDEFERLAAAGVIVIGAAGNLYNSQSVPGLGFPAADPNVIGVSGVWADNYGQQSLESGTNFFTGPDHVAAFSQRHPTMTDIFAPAGLIATAAIGGGTTTRRGTSFAAPFVTGAAVLVQQLAEQELGRRLTVDEFRELLVSTGVVINDGDNEVDNVPNTEADYRRLNILALAESVLLNPGPPVLSIVDVTVTEGDTGTAIADVVVQLSRAPSDAVTVQYTTADGTASLAGNDYHQTIGQLTFLPGGPLTQSIVVPIVGDTRHEQTETLRVELSAATNATLLDPQATITIQDNDQSLPWQNPLEPLDVNNNGFITGLDALLIINKLNTTGPEVLPATPPPAPYFFYDVSGDGRMTALDALMVINYLNNAGAAQVAAAGPAADDTVQGDLPVNRAAPLETPAADNRRVPDGASPKAIAPIEPSISTPASPPRLRSSIPSVRPPVETPSETDPIIAVEARDSTPARRRGPVLLRDPGDLWTR